MKTSDLLHIGILFVVALLLISCGNPERDFKKAEQTNTEQAFDDFIRKHPENPLVAQAKTRIEKNAYEEARKTATVAAYESFLKRFSTGDLPAQAKRELETLEFNQAKLIAAIPAWEAFLQKYPESTNGPEARRSLAQLVYEEAKRTGTVAAYETFLSHFPASELAAQATSELETLEFDLAAKQPSIATWQAFLKKYPQSPHTKPATDAIARLEYEAAVKEDSIPAYEKFLEKFPRSEMVGDVKHRLEPQLEERDWNQTLLKNTTSAYLDFYKAHPSTTKMKVFTGTLYADVCMVPTFDGPKELPGGNIIAAFSMQQDLAIRLTIKEHPDFKEEIDVKEAVRMRVWHEPVLVTRQNVPTWLQWESQRVTLQNCGAPRCALTHDTAKAARSIIDGFLKNATIIMVKQRDKDTYKIVAIDIPEK